MKEGGGDPPTHPRLKILFFLIHILNFQKQVEYKLVTSIPHLLKFMTEVCQYIDKKNETKQKQNKANKSKTNKTSDGQSGSLLS